MGKKKAFSEPRSESTDIELDDSERQINRSLQSANLISKKHLLRKDLMAEDVHHIILNKKSLKYKTEENMHPQVKKQHYSKLMQKSHSSSDGSDSEDESTNTQLLNNFASKKFNIKVRNRKKEKVSSSSESSDEDVKRQVPTGIKKDKMSAEESELSDSNNLNSVHTPKKKNYSENVKRKNASSSCSEANLESETEEIMTTNVRHSPEKKLPEVSFSSEDDENNEKNSSSLLSGLFKSNKAKKRNLNASKSETLDASDIMMEKIQKKMHKKSQLGTESSPKTKVNVLQDIFLTPKPKTIKELEEMYPGIKQMKTDIHLEFSSSEDIYLFRIPNTVDPCSLENAKINLEEKCKIKIGGEKYCIKSTPKAPDPALVASDYCNIVKFKGNIIMEKYIKSKKEPNLVISERESVPLPDNLKKRHPLFGPDYKHKIKLSDEVEKKLDEAIENLLREQKPKKKKLEKTKLETKVEEGNQEDIFALLNSHTLSNKSKKIKKEVSDDSAICSSSSIEKTRKKDRYDKNNINDTLERIKTEIFTETESDGIGSKFIKKKKNKGRKSASHKLPNMKIIKKDIKKESNGEEDLSAVSNHDGNRLSMVNSTFMPNIFQIPNFNHELSTIILEDTNSEKKSKKSKRKDEDMSGTENKLISDILDGLKSDMNSSKKLKKKKKHKLEETAGDA